MFCENKAVADPDVFMFLAVPFPEAAWCSGHSAARQQALSLEER